MDTTVPPEEGNPGGSLFDRLMLPDHSGQECWSARDLHAPMGYDKWERFEVAINRAIAAAANSGLNPLDHFRGASKAINGGRWGRQTVSDYRLTRYACYLIAMNGDPRKPEIAAAQTYFAVRTRQAEAVQQPADVSSPEGILALAEKFVEAARELVSTKKELAIAAPKAGKWDAFCDSDGLIDMAAAAKALNKITGGLGRTKFMELLRCEDIRFLQRQNPRLPYECHTKTGRAEVKFVATPNGQWVEQTFFTGKGLDWLVDRLGGSMPTAA
ncbi:phage antirepressor KilAC domain-containing protein [Streptomyces sp. NPDC059426]|uniref:phage antirepressor KilAC domain-containing protein n=1 Tax=Streptomyces sp. NPDC059426 TaxID=3346827 RepID=UPI003676BE10